MISQWLGHASIETTMRYARADIDMERQALLQVSSDVLAAVKPDRRAFHSLLIVEWMKQL